MNFGGAIDSKIVYTNLLTSALSRAFPLHFFLGIGKMQKQLRFHQAGLFDSENGKASNGSLRDPAFAENKGLPIHRWVPWIAGYSASFVDDVLATFAPANAKNGSRLVVLDPFAGVGTTLVQAMVNGCQTVGFDINPYAALAAQVKLKVPLLNLPEFKIAIKEFELSVNRLRKKKKPARSSPPQGFRSRIPF